MLLDRLLFYILILQGLDRLISRGQANEDKYSLNRLAIGEIRFTSDKNEGAAVFSLPFHRVSRWREVTKEFCIYEGLDENSCDRINEVVYGHLQRHGYSPAVLLGTGAADDESELGIDSLDSILRLLEAGRESADTRASFESLEATDPRSPSPSNWYEERVVFAAHGGAPGEPLFLTDPLDDTQSVLLEILNGSAPWHRKAALARTRLVTHQTIIVYQTRNTETGGTLALRDLYAQLVSLGFHARLCDAANHLQPECASPDTAALVISGEWCSEVLEDHGLPNGRHWGRGVQYFLGFHHADDSCVGTVMAADSDYLHKQLSLRILSGYFLGCPMRDSLKIRLGELLADAMHRRRLPPRVESIRRAFDPRTGRGTGANIHGGGDQGRDFMERALLARLSLPSPVKKERLIIIDPDFHQDYPPTEGVPDVAAPPGWRVVVATGFHPSEMTLLLERAALVIDLGMPGPERLTSEATLLGALPVIAERWNGASRVDFPGAWRVDALNGSALQAVVEQAALAYPASLDAPTMGKQFAYVASMWRRGHSTAEVYFGSSHLHFVLAPTGLITEHLALLQLATILRILPLASVTLYVTDVFWFIRHHYSAFTTLRKAGYIRHDPMNPVSFGNWQREGQSGAFVRILARSKWCQVVGLLPEENPLDLNEPPSTSDSEQLPSLLPPPLSATDLSPPWLPLLIVVAPGVTVWDPHAVMELAAQTMEQQQPPFTETANGIEGGFMVQADTAVLISPDALLSKPLKATLACLTDSPSEGPAYCASHEQCAASSSGPAAEETADLAALAFKGFAHVCDYFHAESGRSHRLLQHAPFWTEVVQSFDASGISFSSFCAGRKAQRPPA